jgi:hypothetical protein
MMPVMSEEEIGEVKYERIGRLRENKLPKPRD